MDSKFLKSINAPIFAQGMSVFSCLATHFKTICVWASYIESITNSLPTSISKLQIKAIYYTASYMIIHQKFPTLQNPPYIAYYLK